MNHIALASIITEKTGSFVPSIVAFMREDPVKG
jgi:hypothetical protein